MAALDEAEGIVAALADADDRHLEAGHEAFEAFVADRDDRPRCGCVRRARGRRLRARLRHDNSRVIPIEVHGDGDVGRERADGAVALVDLGHDPGRRRGSARRRERRVAEEPAQHVAEISLGAGEGGDEQAAGGRLAVAAADGDEATVRRRPRRGVRRGGACAPHGVRRARARRGRASPRWSGRRRKGGGRRPKGRGAAGCRRSRAGAPSGCPSNHPSPRRPSPPLSGRWRADRRPCRRRRASRRRRSYGGVPAAAGERDGFTGRVLPSGWRRRPRRARRASPRARRGRRGGRRRRAEAAGVPISGSRIAAPDCSLWRALAV
jgi:hypothetical protein